MVISSSRSILLFHVVRVFDSLSDSCYTNTFSLTLYSPHLHGASFYHFPPAASLFIFATCGLNTLTLLSYFFPVAFLPLILDPSLAHWSFWLSAELSSFKFLYRLFLAWPFLSFLFWLFLIFFFSSAQGSLDTNPQMSPYQCFLSLSTSVWPPSFSFSLSTSLSNRSSACQPQLNGCQPGGTHRTCVCVRLSYKR